MKPMKLFSDLKRFHTDNAGAVAGIYAVALPIIIGSFAFSVELGLYMKKKRTLQTAADMAAIAGAKEFDLTDDRDATLLAVKADVYQNGFKFDDGTLTVESPITSGAYANQEGIHLTLTQSQERYFSKALPGTQAVTHTVSATALLKDLGQPVCALALDPTASGAITVTGSSDINLGACSMHSNSNATPSVDLSGAGQLSAECLSASGSISNGYKANLSVCKAVEANMPTAVDPYEDITLPDGWQSLPCQDVVYGASKTSTMTPGRYCADIGIGGVLTLTQPGVYILDGAGLFIKSKGSMYGPTDESQPGITNGVTLIFTNGGRLENNNGGVIDLTAPADGPYKGILMYGDRDTNVGANPFKFNGNQAASLDGALYFPVQHVDFRGTSDVTSGCTHIISKTMEFSGNSSLTNVDCKSVGARNLRTKTGGPKIAMLVE